MKNEKKVEGAVKKYKTFYQIVVKRPFKLGSKRYNTGDIYEGEILDEMKDLLEKRFDTKTGIEIEYFYEVIKPFREGAKSYKKGDSYNEKVSEEIMPFLSRKYYD